jgi:holliday junction DNA helicase RuvA
MIAYLKGTLLNKSKNFLIVENLGLGYQVFVAPTVYTEVVTGQPLELYIHDHIKEDAHDLYGFRNLDELEMFELLISISGVGPKSGLGVMAIASVADLKEAIVRGDATLLTKVSGVGRKTAERVVLELREKIAALPQGASGGQAGDFQSQSDELDALMALGYSLVQSRDALKQVDPQIAKSGERIREALKYLAK